ncbi:UvrD-helicase domain-containing protein [Winogradskyella sp. A2]|uniref:UvrD-helicase domain-containing protein n=1 Tax=Winogradskyella sp. A2 TaxID=3366944 RepID=UPI00398C5E50
MQNSAYKIYNASAGSGKTFTLTKSYLKILIASDNPEFFKHLLAITFTNKAVTEMKERIINMLKHFSSEQGINEPHDMFVTICNELNISPKSLHIKAKQILKHIIHNYGAFDISTIDGFTHRIIRTFAQDLKLPVNFEVELDKDRLLSEAVESLISKAGTDNELTKILVDFAIEKANDDKSWDVSYDFNKISKLLVNENDLIALNTLANKSLTDFQKLKSKLFIKIKSIETEINELAKTTLTLIAESGIEHSDFTGGKRAYLPNYFKKLLRLDLRVDYSATWILNLEEKPLYPVSSTTNHIKEVLDAIKPDIISFFKKSKELYYELKLQKGLYRNLTPLSVLNAIKSELKTIKEEQNKLLISEFNTLISNEIKDQPTPFIYERLGEKYKHYFIDEFQDTSVMQWNNLIPLIDNALSTANGSLMLVGDAKQAIYRWRGGKVEQFIDLYNRNNNPFQTKVSVESLDTNYRSSREIVNFNNEFFDYLSRNFFSDNNYSELYQNSRQNVAINKTGYVNLSFIDNLEDDDEASVLYSKKVLVKIQQCLFNGYKLSEICVLVRKHNEGVIVSDYLSENSIEITSSETLLIKNSEKIVFINNLIKLLVQPDNSPIKIEVLTFISKLNNINDKHSFYLKHNRTKLSDLFNSLKSIGYFIDIADLLQLPLYELIEEIIRVFKLNNKPDAFLQYYLDFVLEFTQKQNSDIGQFIEYFEQKKEKLGISSPDNLNAVNIMTIHKSKGLEFPVVIFPFAELNIYKELDPKVWFSVDSDTNEGFDTLLLNYNKDIENFGVSGKSIFDIHQSQLELDNINLLYVALTRPIDQLYIISKKDFNKKGELNTKTYSGMLISYLQSIGQWSENETDFNFGLNEQKDIKATGECIVNSVALKLISSKKEDHNLQIITKSGLLWDTKQEKAMEKGNLIHELLSKIKTKADVSFAFEEMVLSGDVSKEVLKLLQIVVNKVINHEKLKAYFTNDYRVFNEKDIITKSGQQVRPDRLNFNSKNEVVIIDYKTGQQKSSYTNQLLAYENVLNEMNYKVIHKFIVYINEDIEVIEV